MIMQIVAYAGDMPHRLYPSLLDDSSIADPA
jgi:hypothetical protein